jgi:tRNA A-37 threonylcarbamoyl transferase component Bud32
VKFAQPFTGYEILERVGSGAMGTVFKARDRKLDRVVALKVLQPSLARDQRYVERLRREARIVASLNHPNIVTGYDLGEEGGYHFFVMEFVEGRSLRALLSEWGMFPEQQVLHVAQQVAAALDHAHRRGVIHRDIKPGNILITEQNVVKLTDMGLAKGPTDFTITRDGATVGTPQYISPEQARDPQIADIRSDLYSLGATLYHMATGSPPFVGKTMAQVITQVLSERAPSASELNPTVSDGLSLVIRKLLAKDPGLRYQTPLELIEDLRLVERAEAPRVDARRLDREQAPSRGRWRVAARTAAACAVVGGAAWFLLPRSGVAAGDAGLEKFGQQLTAQLEGVASPGAKLKLLRAAAVAATDAQRNVIEGMRFGIEADFRAAADAFFDGYASGDRRARAEDWFLDPRNWRTPERFFSEELEAAMADALGARPGELSPSLREYIERREQDLRTRAGSWQQARDAGYQAMFTEYLAREVAEAWSAPLAARDFAGAERGLRRAIDAFFERERLPTREQLPDALREFVGARARETQQQALASITSEEEGLAGALRSHVATELANLNDRRRELGVARRRELFEELRRELAAYPPPQAFRPNHDPWRDVSDQLRQFADTLAAGARLEEAAALDQAVARAYRTLVVSGDPHAAAGWLEHLELDDANKRATRDRHLRLLEGAGVAWQRLTDALLGGSAARVVEVHRAGDARGPALSVRVERSGDRIVLAEGDGAALAPSQVYWPDLLAAAGAKWSEGLPDAERRRALDGLALWLFVSGDDAGTMRVLDPTTRAFFAQCVTEPVDRVRKSRSADDQSALQLLQAVRAEFEREGRELAAVQAALRAFRARHADDALEGDARGFLRRVDEWVQEEEENARLAERLRARVSAEVTVAVRSPQVATLTFGLPAMIAAGLPEGWVEEGAELAFAGHDLDLEAARARRALTLHAPLEDAKEVVLEARVRFPALVDEYRLYAFEIWGMACVVGLLRDGSVCAAAGSSDILSKGNDLRRLLRPQVTKAIAQPPLRVVPEAEYVLRLEWQGPQRHVQVLASLDGVEIARHAMTRPPRVPNAVRLLPLQPLRVVALQLTGKL